MKISDRVDGAIVAPAMPMMARLAMSISELVENAASNDAEREARGAAEQELAAADAIPERAHGDEQAGDQEAVDVDDPEQLRARRRSSALIRGIGEVEHGQVHRVDERGQREHGETDPFAPGRPRRNRVFARHLIHALQTSAGRRTHRSSSCHGRRNRPISHQVSVNAASGVSSRTNSHLVSIEPMGHAQAPREVASEVPITLMG